MADPTTIPPWFGLPHRFGCGDRIRARGRITVVSEKRPGQWLLATKVTVDIENSSTPALIAELLSLFIVDTNQEAKV